MSNNSQLLSPGTRFRQALAAEKPLQVVKCMDYHSYEQKLDQLFAAGKQ